jgi:hypothetical protein
MNKVVLLCVLTLPALPLQAQSQFAWSLALLNQRVGVSVSLERPALMETGDIVSFYVTSEADCYCFLVAQSSDNEVAVLHSRPLKAGEEIRTGAVQLAEPPGTETFFIVMSAGRQRKLEQAVEAHARNPASTRTGRAVLNEVFALRREVSRLGEKPEQPVYLGGAFRALDVEGTLFSGADMYVKTVSISH